MHHKYSHSIPYGSNIDLVNNLGSIQKITKNFDGFFQTVEHDKKRKSDQK